MLKKIGTLLLPLACAFSVHATDIAQFSTYVYPNNSNPVNVPFPSGSVLNPFGANSFSVSITNTGLWASTTVPFPPFTIPGDPTGSTVTQSQLSASIISALGTTSGLDVLGFKSAAGTTVTINLNFSNLPGGFLPAGSLLAYADVDHAETTTITGASGWFNLGTITALDVTNGTPISFGTEPDPAPADLMAFSGSGTTLTLTGQTNATDSPGVIIPLASNTTSLTIVATHPSATFYQSFGIAVPEPSSMALLGTAAVPLFFFAQIIRRRKHRK
jgi:hypothetical protein